MKKGRFTEEQIAYALHQAETGTSVAEVIRKIGISEQTFYRWKKQYGSLKPDQARELKQLQEENARLKKLVAHLSLDKAICRTSLQKIGRTRAEGASLGQCPRPLRHQSASGLIIDSGVEKHTLLRAAQRPAATVATAYARSCQYTGALGPSPAARSVAARRLAARVQPVLPPLS